MYKTLPPSDVAKFLSEGKTKEVWKMVGHTWKPLKHVGKQYCSSCGLVRVNNKFTEWCIDKGCMNSDHPQYESAMKRLTKQEWDQ
jgi:hypothetical protein